MEIWRTAPYLHLGHAVTLQEVLTTFNKDDKHGKTSQLSPEQIDQLVAYMMQIGPTEDDGGSQADAGTDPRGPDAAAIIPTPGPDPGRTGGCMCHVGAIAGDPARASAYRMMVSGMAMLMLTVWRRRRVLRPRISSHQAASES